MKTLDKIIKDTEKRLQAVKNYKEGEWPFMDTLLKARPSNIYSLFRIDCTTLQGFEELMGLHHDLYDDGELHVTRTENVSVREMHERLNARLVEQGKEPRPVERSWNYLITGGCIEESKPLGEDDILKILDAMEKCWDYYYDHKEQVEANTWENRTQEHKAFCQKQRAIERAWEEVYTSNLWEDR